MVALGDGGHYLFGVYLQDWYAQQGIITKLSSWERHDSL